MSSHILANVEIQPQSMTRKRRFGTVGPVSNLKIRRKENGGMESPSVLCGLVPGARLRLAGGWRTYHASTVSHISPAYSREAEQNSMLSQGLSYPI